MPPLHQRVQYRVVADYRRLATRSLREPSFVYKLGEAARIRRQMRELGVKDPAFGINGKEATQQWAARLGVPVPAAVGSYATARDVPWTSLPDRCVVKPHRGTTSTGVFLLHRSGAQWRDVRTGRTSTSAEIVRELDGLVAAGTISPEVLVEELVTDPRVPDAPPFDYKVSTFFGRVGLIEAKSHERAEDGRPISRWRIFSPEWKDLGDAFHDQLNRRIPPPAHPNEVLDLARRISAAVPRAYLRVDLFDTDDGPVLGELTPEPGGPMLARRDVDRDLGRLWEDAEARLRVRVARSGLLDPLEAPLDEAWHLRS